MAQDLREGADVHTVFDGPGGEGVTDAVKIQVGNAKIVKHFVVLVAQGPGGQLTAVVGGTDEFARNVAFFLPEVF